MKKYEDILKDICNVEDLHYLRGREWEGCLGVACVLSFMEGVPATLPAIGKHLSMSPYNQSLGAAFSRLKGNNIFTEEYGVKEDACLKGDTNFSPNLDYVTPQHMSELAWCQIAGIAGGFTGMKEEKRKKVEEVEKVEKE